MELFFAVVSNPNVYGFEWETYGVTKQIIAISWAKKEAQVHGMNWIWVNSGRTISNW